MADGSCRTSIARAIRARSNWRDNSSMREFAMPDTKPDSRVRSTERQTALGAKGNDPKVQASSSQADPAADKRTDTSPPLIDAELVQLRVRVIALENIVIALLAQAPERQRELAREMAVHISPRPGFTPHPMTVHAAAEMNSLVRRAETFRSGGYVPRDDAQPD